MPDTPTRPASAKVTAGRPDVGAIKARVEHVQRAFGDEAFWAWVWTDIPALIAYIGWLEARQVKLEAVVTAAREWRQSLEGDGWAKDVIEHGAARPGMGKLMEALAALGEGDG